MIYRVNYEIAKEVWKQDLWSYGNSADKKYSNQTIEPIGTKVGFFIRSFFFFSHF